jgi:hypothetical protein
MNMKETSASILHQKVSRKLIICLQQTPKCQAFLHQSCLKQNGTSVHSSTVHSNPTSLAKHANLPHTTTCQASHPSQPHPPWDTLGFECYPVEDQNRKCFN